MAISRTHRTGGGEGEGTGATGPALEHENEHLAGIDRVVGYTHSQFNHTCTVNTGPAVACSAGSLLDGVHPCPSLPWCSQSAGEGNCCPFCITAPPEASSVHCTAAGDLHVDAPLLTVPLVHGSPTGNGAPFRPPSPPSPPSPRLVSLPPPPTGPRPPPWSRESVVFGRSGIPSIEITT